MLKITYEAEFRNIDFGKFEQPELINLIFNLDEYEFTVSTYYDELFSVNEYWLTAIEIKKNKEIIYTNRPTACCEEYGYIDKKKIINKPRYKKAILNLNSKIRYYLNNHLDYFDDFSDAEQTLTNEKIEEIIDIWQLIVKNIFSEKGE